MVIDVYVLYMYVCIEQYGKSTFGPPLTNLRDQQATTISRSLALQNRSHFNQLAVLLPFSFLLPVPLLSPQVGLQPVNCLLSSWNIEIYFHSHIPDRKDSSVTWIIDSNKNWNSFFFFFIFFRDPSVFHISLNDKKMYLKLYDCGLLTYFKRNEN